MSEDPATDPFFDCVHRLGWLKEPQLERMRREMDKSGEPPLQVAVRLGYLESTRLDVVRMLLDPGDPIPGYEILDVLGIGGMGVVYRARQKALDRIVAIKTVQLKSIDSTSSLDRFEQEARALAKLQHPNIVGAIDFGRHEGRVYLVMEFVGGEDLQSCLRRNLLFSERRVWKIIRQAAVGLAHAAKFGIVHRDIKPGNLMLVEQGRAADPGEDLVKIADFGLARLTDENQASRITTDGMAVGTPPYMAPEQLQGDDINFRADVYALGATAYHLLGHEVPFSGMVISQIVARKLQQGPKPLISVAPSLSSHSIELVDDMLRINPAQRPDYNQLIARIDAMIPSLAETAAHTFSFADTMLVPKKGDVEKHDSTIPTLPLLKRHPQAAWSLIIAAVLMIASLVLLAPWWRGLKTQDVTPVRQNLTALGPPRLLVRPQSLDGWQIVSGSWIASPDDPVLVGTSGAILRPLLKSAQVAVEAYHFEVIIDPLNATAAEVQFGVEHTPEMARYVARCSERVVQIGREVGDFGKFEPLANIPSRAVPTDRPFTLVVERQPTGWFVDVNDQPFASLPRSRQSELPEIRLAVEQGPAHFSDMELTELDGKSAN